MTVYADEPRWPRHGMWWGHLVSDTSLDELHAAADAAQIPGRAFDLDHYDWPAQARGGLERAGVAFVDSHALVRSLAASGLRVPGHHRAEARRTRTESNAASLGLARVPLDLITGPRGHVDPLPDLPGAFRLTRDRADDAPRIEAHDAAGEAAARAWIAGVDALTAARGLVRWTGQVLEVG